MMRMTPICSWRSAPHNPPHGIHSIGRPALEACRRTIFDTACPLHMQPSKQTTRFDRTVSAVAKSIAPEDIRLDDFVTKLHVIWK